MARKTTRRKAVPAANAAKEVKTEVVAEELTLQETPAEEAVVQEPAPAEEQPAAELPAAETVEETEKPEEPAEAQETVKKRGRKPGTRTKQKEVRTEKAAPENTKTIYVQYGGHEYKTEDVMANVQAAWVAEGHRASSIKNLDIYIKPEEGMAYYVINGKNSGSVSLF